MYEHSPDVKTRLFIEEKLDNRFLNILKIKNISSK